MKEKPYVAVIGDIKSSQHLDDRGKIQESLKRVLREINQRYADHIASNFTITLGDEFQGLLHDGAIIMQMITKIEQEMYPVKIRFGIGIGKITTPIDREIALGADGPAYYNAREAIEYLKRREKKKQTANADIRIVASDVKQPEIEQLNVLLQMMTALKDDWKEKQRKTIYDMLEHGDSQVNAAKRLRVGQPAVQKSLASGKYYAYKETLDTVQKALRSIAHV